MSTEDEKLLKEAKKLLWEDRLLHKTWKVRNDANIDLAALCDSVSDPKDPRLREFGQLGFRDLVSLLDTNKEEFDLPEETYVDKCILQTMGKRYCDRRSRLKNSFMGGDVNCPA